MAIATLVNGPASATSDISRLPSLRLNGSTGTGFAAPKIIGEPETIRRRGSKILMKGSMCFLGLRVNLPINLAVGSPKRSATNPWATSWKIAEKTRIIIEIMPPIRASILFETKIYDIINAMAKGMKCDNCGKGIMIGHNVSHAKNRTRRIFKPNLHSVRVVVNGVGRRIKLCTKCLRIAKKEMKPGTITSEVVQAATL